VPVRKIPRSYQNVTGLIATDKSDQLTAYESGLEYCCQKLIGFNLNILKYEEQPVRIYYSDGDGKLRHYTPDILATYRNDVAPAKYWKPLLIEVKYRSTLCEKWHELKPKFQAARQHAKDQGLEFAILTEREIYTPYLNNAIFLIDFRWLPVNEAYTNLLLETLNELHETTPQALLFTITQDRQKMGELLPFLWQLVANYVIGVNLEEPLTMTSRIWSTLWLGKDAVYEPLHQLRRGRSRQIRWQAIRYYPPLRS
jgi:hypothetical protein